MLIILTETEIMEAIKSYLGNEYDIKESRLVAGRNGNGHRLELEVVRNGVEAPKIIQEVTEPKEEKDEPPFDIEEKEEETFTKQDGPIFAKLG